jgi:ACT domain-containing protein
MKPFRNIHSNLPSDNTKLLNLEIKFAQNVSQASVRLSFRQQDNRLVISRKDNQMLSPLQSSKSRKDRRAAIQSANVSREKIDVEESGIPRLQFSKDQRNKVKNWHKRTKSNHIELYDIQEDQMSNFSNSLQNISQEIIEIPFANQVIHPPRGKNEGKGKIGASLTQSSSSA